MANLATIQNNILADSGIDPIDLIVGTGTINYIPKFTAEGAIGDSIMSQSGSNILISGNIALHAGNYNNYAPTLTGGGASGTWGINISGVAAQVAINYNNDSNSTYQMLWGSGNSIYGSSLVYINPYTDTIYAAAYRGSANVGGTGEATYHPAGIYSQGTNWLYGTMYRDGYNTYNANGSIYQIGLLELNNGFQISQGGSNYGQFNSWVFLPSYHGFYSGQNSAHFYPNDGTYGAWKISGSRAGWGGIEFVTGNGNLVLMISTDSNSVGFHNNSYGWQTLWQNGTLYVYKNSYGGGTQATVLDSSNYNAYAPTLTGGNASGTWGINITGSAGYASSAGNADTVDGYHASAFALVNGNTGQSFGVFELTYAQTQFNPSLGPRGGLNAMSIKMWDNYFAGIGLGSDYGTVMEYYGRGGHVDTQVYFDAAGGSWYRTAPYASGWGSWQNYLTSNNYNSYAPTLTGGGASGTWGINISGTASSETLATVVARGNTTGGGRPIILDNGGGAIITQANGGGWAMGSYYKGSAGTYLAGFGAYGGDNSLIYAWIGAAHDNAWLQINPSSANFQVPLQQGGNQVLHAGNYTSYAVQTTGQSNWNNYSVIGNVVGLLAWKNYGNYHVIFDASQSTSPNGTSVNNTNSQSAWTATYPTLMGWNGNTTYGVRVDSARVADSAGSVDFNSLTNKTGGTGTYQTSGDFRAPIFYDSNDTSYYLDPNAGGTSLKINGGIISTIANGGILLKHEVSEANSWIFRESAVNWGLFWLNDGSQSGQTIGSYTTIGAELFGMNNGVTGFNPNSAWSGTDSSTRAAWMLSNYSGYFWTQGTQYSATDMRAPIFYDSQNTAYYLDPNNFSNLFSATFNSTVNLQGTTWFGGYGPGSGPGIAFENLGTFARIVFWGLDFYDWNHARQMVIDNNYVYVDNYLQAGASLRAPIFYDSNDTGYYLDPNSTSNLYSVVTVETKARKNQSDNNYTTAALWTESYGNTTTGIAFHISGVVGKFLEMRTNGVLYWANDQIVTNNGGTWNINISGSSSSAQTANVAYDLQAADATLIRFNSVSNTDYSTMTFMSRAWQSVQGANGLAYTFNTHTDGGAGGYGALQIFYGQSGHVFAPTSFRAPIFYDSQDTGYYVDPNSSSRLSTLTTEGRIYSNEWIQFSNYTGLYSPNNGAHFRPNSGSYGPWLVSGTRNGWNGLEFDGLATGNVSLMIHSNEVGFHNNNYGWQFRWTEGYLYCYRSTYGAGTVYQVWDSGSAPRASNSNLMYYQGFTLDADTMDTNSTGFTYAVNAPYVGPITRISTGGAYDLWFNAPYGGGGTGLAFRTRNGDSATLNPWRIILNDANYTNYAVPTSGYTFGSTFIMGTMYVSTGEQFTPSYLLGVFSNGYAYKFPLAGIQSWIGLGNYLPLSGGTMSGQILGPSVGDSVYGGLIQIRERGYVLATQDAWSYSPAITFHWGDRWVKRFGGRADGQIAVDDVPIVLNTGTWSINVTGTSGSISGFNNPTTAATPNTIVYRDGIGDITTRELVLNVGVQDFTPSSMVAIYPTTNQAVKVTASGARNFLNVPTRTGGDASGTWGINITGSSNSSNYSSYLTSNNASVSSAFVSWNSVSDTTNNVDNNYWYGMRVSHGDALSYYSFTINASFFTNGAVYYRRIQNGVSQGWINFLDSTNYNSYSPTLTGGGASGTWGINITGSAGSVTHLQSRTDGTWYNAVWATGNPSYMYSCDAVQIQSSSGALRANIYYDNQDTSYYLDPNSTSRLYRVNSYYFSNTVDVSDNHPFGIYFASNLSEAYGIFRESGPWDWPYPDLRIAFHTGIKIGANASYKGVKFYTDYDMVTLVLSVNNADYNTGGIYVHGTAYASAYYETSDARVKTILEDNSRVEGIELIKPKLYQKDGKTEFGYIAQDFLDVMPYAVNNDNVDEMYSLVYREVHTAKIAFLEDSVDGIKKKIKELEEKLNALY